MMPLPMKRSFQTMAKDDKEKKRITKRQPLRSRQSYEVKVSASMRRMTLAETQSVVKAKELGGVDFMCSKSYNYAHNKERIDKNDSGHEHGKFHWQQQVGKKEAGERDLKGDKYAIVKCSCCTIVQYKVKQDLINWKIEHEDTRALGVRNTLNLYCELYKEFSGKLHQSMGRDVHAYVVKCIENRGMRIFPEKPFGHIRGIQIGDTFEFRSQLKAIGLHNNSVSGIASELVGGKRVATSVVDSGRYGGKRVATMPEVLIYSGQGGVSRVTKEVSDQELKNGNLALLHSMQMRYPVRLTSRRRSSGFNSSLRKDKDEYIYNGLYSVDKCFKERADNNKMVFKFELARLPDQPRPHQMVRKMNKSMSSKEVCEPRRSIMGSCKQTNHKEICISNDISDGKERVKIRVLNDMGTDRPMPFTYVKTVVYPDFELIVNPFGCDCNDGCSSLRRCICVSINGGNIPFNEKGAIAIIPERSTIHECGPWCKCPSSCKNRVSQHGPKYEFEIFKTKSARWGLRSRSYIKSGSFICEYAGVLTPRHKGTSKGVGEREYVWDIPTNKATNNGYYIDAVKYGNIGRFVNHSCNPNLFAQEVLYDHGDKTMPHIMFFAIKDISPKKELTCDYTCR